MADSKKILITGTSAGFGFDAAKALAEAGHTVYATMRGVDGKNAGKAQDLAEFAKKGGCDVHVLELDVTDETSVDRAVDKAVELGGIDILINNAGMGAAGVQESFTLDQVHTVFDVNVFGVLRMNRAVLPHFRDRGSGVIVFLSSGLGRLVFPFLGPYTATKFAIEALAQTASYELEPLGIRCVIVQPGAYGTSFLQNAVQPADGDRLSGYGPVKNMLKGFFGALEARVRAGQMGDPKEVVEALVEIAGADPAALPSRRPVGADVSDPVTALNRFSDQIQNQVLKARGLK
ncbi:MAG: SDR family oxidoreductase [Proteobacteria bacterium]|nr:SDR family oxidoreductase [Pseudomonadota bacterium]